MGVSRNYCVTNARPTDSKIELVASNQRDRPKESDRMPNPKTSQSESGSVPAIPLCCYPNVAEHLKLSGRRHEMENNGTNHQIVSWPGELYGFHSIRHELR